MQEIVCRLDFDQLANKVRQSFKKYENLPLFRTNADVWRAYITSFDDPEERRVHNCSACAHFLRRYGGLVIIQDDGTIMPTMWDFDLTDLPPEFQNAAVRCWNAVVHAEVVGTFHSKEANLGHFATHDDKRGVDWHHFAVKLPTARLHTSATVTARQQQAADLVNFQAVRRMAEEVLPATAAQAADYFRSGALNRGTEFLPRVLDFIDAQKRFREQADVGLWATLAAKTQLRSITSGSALGALFGWIAKGETQASVVAQFNAMVDPMAYQRTTAPPKAGNLQQAEKTLQALGIELADLNRRWATMAEGLTSAEWPRRTVADVSAASGMFGHLAQPAKPTPLVLPAKAISISWERFVETVLPMAVQLVVDLERQGSYPFGGLTMPQKDSAAQIFAWPGGMSWYRHVGKRPANPGQHPVLAVCAVPSPALNGAVLLLSGLRDDAAEVGLGLFPELLRSDLHPVRRTIEAHAYSQQMADPGGDLALGLVLRDNAKFSITLGVKTEAGQVWKYLIDRWA